MPATVETTRKHNRTSLPQGTARERELFRLSKLPDTLLAEKDDEEILGTRISDSMMGSLNILLMLLW